MSFGKVAAFAAMLCGLVCAQAAFAQEPPPPGAPPPEEAGAPPPPGAGGPPPAVTGSNVNLRQGPGTSYSVITLIPAGSPLDVGSCKGGWCQVSFQGQHGYIIASALGGPGGPPPGAVAGGPVPVGPGGPPPGYYPPPPGYYPPPPPYYYGYGPYYGPYGPHWHRGYYRRW